MLILLLITQSFVAFTFSLGHSVADLGAPPPLLQAAMHFSHYTPLTLHLHNLELVHFSPLHLQLTYLYYISIIFYCCYLGFVHNFWLHKPEREKLQCLLCSSHVHWVAWLEVGMVPKNFPAHFVHQFWNPHCKFLDPPLPFPNSVVSPIWWRELMRKSTLEYGN